MFLALLGVLAVGLAAGPAQACAVCGHATTPGDPLGRGFYWGMLFLLAMPFTVVGGFGGWVAYMYWRARHPRPTSLRDLAVKARALLPARIWIRKESET
jgi:hypothetical protein